MGVGNGCHPSLRFFGCFSLEDKASATDAFSSCSFNLRAHFETILVMVSYYI